ncbi:hypothetical protein B0T20DRAFT_180225 [Sordaria brevicollis]|uniref:Secreted protein n=1 Tax=Sordaria brevicollis TaxID=83679 RepID=A0AAE0UE89_SORBR|nr:hypothetical protein B0T20DRAFT_180225 [Sordaria brevicollis]
MAFGSWIIGCRAGLQIHFLFSIAADLWSGVICGCRARTRGTPSRRVLTYGTETRIGGSSRAWHVEQVDMLDGSGKPSGTSTWPSPGQQEPRGYESTPIRTPVDEISHHQATASACW